VPLIKIINLDKNIFVGIWAITEDLHALAQQANATLLNETEKISHPLKKREFLASRLALETICKSLDISDTNIRKTKDGKPYFPQSKWQFSISHTEKYAICAVHPEKPLGVDVEKIRQKFNVISKKFLTASELSLCKTDIEKIALRWCIKEAAYKWNGEKGLNFKEEIVISADMKQVSVKGVANNIYYEKIDPEHFWVVVQ